MHRGKEGLGGGHCHLALPFPGGGRYAALGSVELGTLRFTARDLEQVAVSPQQGTLLRKK